MTVLSGWGRYPRVDVRTARVRGMEETLDSIHASDSLIARGNGRAYGDSALNKNVTLSLLPSDRILAFDAESGRLTCEAGFLLADLLAIFVPRGWFVPVTPGTKHVTIGGMIAADVHGKNHHINGSFGAHIESLELALADGQVVRCSPQENADVFAATCGGMGLTGVILSATFRLVRVETAYLRQETLKANNLAEIMTLFEQSQQWAYSVAWIDCLARGASLGRSLLYRGEHARLSELPAASMQHPLQIEAKRQLRLPCDLPRWALNRWSMTAFNAWYYRRARPGMALVDYDTFFYPLDALREWNRMYGRNGFVQYQCVLPKAASAEGIVQLLERISRSGRASFLAVLKLFGRQDGMLSFPMEGYTLALDFPADAQTFRLLDELDVIVANHGGRLYLAKDARMDAAMLRGYAHLEAFRSVRWRVDPERKFSSLQSERLGL